MRDLWALIRRSAPNGMYHAHGDYPTYMVGLVVLCLKSGLPNGIFKMGKRSNYKRIERDSYDTPYNAVIPLLEHLSENTAFIEPCAGKNGLTDHLIQNGHKCLQASDIYPRHENITTQCVFERPFNPEGLIITNPPWDRKILHPFIEKVVAENRLAWLLFDADWCHTKQSIPFMPHVAEIVSIGRVKWIEGSKSNGKDNCAWHKIQGNVGQTIFHGRT